MSNEFSSLGSVTLNPPHFLYRSLSVRAVCSLAFCRLRRERKKKKKKKIHLSAPWPLTPAPDSAAAAPWASGPLRGGLECVQVRGFGLSRRLEESFPGQTGLPLWSFSPSLSHSFIRSFSLGPDSNQRLLEDTRDILLQRCGTNTAGNLNSTVFAPFLPCSCCCVDTSWSMSGRGGFQSWWKPHSWATSQKLSKKSGQSRNSSWLQTNFYLCGAT